MRLVKTNYFLLFILLVFSMLFCLNFVSAANCWQYNSSSTCITSTGCKWKNDSWSTTGWCEELNCWSLASQSECTSTSVPGKNCTWQGGGTTYNCEKYSCWSLSGTNESYCVNNTKALNCQWSGSCYQSGTGNLNCWYQQNQSACLNVTGCSWGNCMDRGCYSYTTNATCNAGKDFNGRNCSWEGNPAYCTENGCWKYNNNQTDCTNTVITKGLNFQW